MKKNPTIDFRTMSDEAIVELGLDAGEVLFMYLGGRGALSDDSFATISGVVDEGTYVQLGQRLFGNDGEKFLVNIGADDGKLNTVLLHDCDSDEAVDLYDLEFDKDDPRGWTGGVYAVARVTIDGVIRRRVFVGAGSGVQGGFDKAILSTILRVAGAAWIEREKALAAA